jgi:hypothetical protein
VKPSLLLRLPLPLRCCCCQRLLLMKMMLQQRLGWRALLRSLCQ